MHPGHHSGLTGFLFACGTILAGLAATWTAARIQKRCLVPEEKLPPRPIVLLPQLSVLLIFGSIGAAMLLLAVSLEVWALIQPQKAGPAPVLGALCAIISAGGLLKTFAFSRERIRIEESKIVHEKWGARIEIDPHDIESLRFRKDFLVIRTKTGRKAVLVSLCFQRIHLLIHALRHWCPEHLIES